MGSPCPTNLTNVTVTTSDLVQQSQVTTLRDSINAEFSRRGLATSSWMDYVNPIDADVYNEMRTEINTKLGGVTPPSPAPSLGTTISAGEVIKADGTSPASFNHLKNKIDEWKVACLCDCNYCTCDCNYCTCDCAYCTCDCNNCGANSSDPEGLLMSWTALTQDNMPGKKAKTNTRPSWWTGGWGSVPAGGSSCGDFTVYDNTNTEIGGVCTCDCNYCTCDCAYCTCDCNYCTCQCNFCPCNCNYCTCNCDQGK